MANFIVAISFLTIFTVTEAFVRANPRYIEGRIVGGEATTIDQIPYQVSLSNRGFSHFCGGSIISEEWILTAAHCAE